jgi:hypothetical protein
MPPAIGARPFRPRKRRRWPKLLVAFAVAAAIAVAGYRYSLSLAERDLEEAIAETDRLDPDWRLEDIERRRTKPPDDQNAAIPISQAAALLKSWRPPGFLRPSPPRRLDPLKVELLRKAVQPFLPVAEIARKAVPLKSGWYAANVPTNDHAEKTFKVGQFLGHLAELQIEDGSFDDAWYTTVTILAVGRSFGDEPTLMASNMRRLLSLAVASSFERCLAQGRVGDALLAHGQEALAEEANQPILYNAFRGERAEWHKTMMDLKSGKTSLSAIVPTLGPVRRALFYATSSSITREHATILRYWNDMVETARSPPAEMLRKAKQLQHTDRGLLPRLSDAVAVKSYEYLLTVSGARCSSEDGYHYAALSIQFKSTLDCAIAGLGVERFRLQHDRWPDSLEEVVAAKLLEKLPPLGYDGQPMAYHATDDGYTLSLNVPSPPLAHGGTGEFRLWDENKRRQLP